MIEVKHKFTINATCPVNGDDDYYDCTITVYRTVPVESITEVIRDLTQKPIMQEELTEELAMRLEASVVTVGDHGNVQTTCSCSA